MQEKLEEEKGKLKELEDDLPNMDTEGKHQGSSARALSRGPHSPILRTSLTTSDGTMPEMSSEVQAAFEAAQKQEHIVDYLSDSVKFTLQMHRYLYYMPYRLR